MPQPYVTKAVDSTSVFKTGIFEGKVLFCTGGGSGICKGMTKAVVRLRKYRYENVCDVIYVWVLDGSWGQCCDLGEKVGIPSILAMPRRGVCLTRMLSISLGRLRNSAEELSKATGKTCIAVQTDVRDTAQLATAVKETISKFGRIDFVICGMYQKPLSCRLE